jgi:hypothetical protein
MKARIPRYLTRFHVTEECLESSLYPQHHILQDLAIDFIVLWHRFFDAGQFRLVLVGGDRDAAFLPSFPALTNGGVVDMATEQQDTLKQSLLFRSRLKLVLIGFTDSVLIHTRLFCLIGAKVVGAEILP